MPSKDDLPQQYIPDTDIDSEDLVEMEDIEVGEKEAEDDRDLSENEDRDQSDREGDGGAQDDTKKKLWECPTVVQAKIAYGRIKLILHPPRNTGKGYKDPKLDLLLRGRLEGMKQFLWTYINPESRSYNKWMAASLEMAMAFEKGPWFARRLREWTSAYIEEEKNLPFNVYGTWNKSRIDDEDLKQEILAHLLGIGKYICAADISRYMARNEVRKRYRMKKGITERTARNWLYRLGYRWTLEPSGQYVDGHERDDVVKYRQDVFLPRWMAFEPRLRIWSLDGKDEDTSTRPTSRILVVWFHDES